MMLSTKELINYDNKVFWLYRKVKHYYIVENNIQDLKEYWGCDVTLKHKTQSDDYVLFLREIPELEMVDDDLIKETENVT